MRIHLVNINVSKADALFTLYTQFYSVLQQNPLQIVQDVATVLGLVIDCEEVLETVQNIKPPSEGYDPETFMFSNHITTQ